MFLDITRSKSSHPEAMCFINSFFSKCEYWMDQIDQFLLHHGISIGFDPHETMMTLNSWIPLAALARSSVSPGYPAGMWTNGGDGVWCCGVLDGLAMDTNWFQKSGDIHSYPRYPRYASIDYWLVVWKMFNFPIYWE